MSAPLQDFLSELTKLKHFDAENQRVFSGSASHSRALSKKQMVLLAESLFFAGFRAYENFIRDVFLLYCQEKPRRDGTKTTSFLKPKSFQHAEELITSSMKYLDWNSPEEMIRRAELFLKDGFPIKDHYVSTKDTFTEMRRVRNHIAHKSSKSFSDYQKVLRQHYGVVPVNVPEPGEYLLQIDRSDPSRYKLVIYFDFLMQSANAIT